LKDGILAAIGLQNLQISLYTVQLKGADKIWARVPHTKRRKTVHINMCSEIFNLSIIAERVHLKQVAKMSSMRFSARLDTSHHGPPHPFKDAGVVVDSGQLHAPAVLFPGKDLPVPIG
jgi:hypothetical protein